MSPTRSQAAIVGAGLMGRWHAHAAARAGGEVVAVVDPDLARARALAARHRGAQVFEKLEEALKASKIEAVHVCSPLDSHVALAREALEAGCHALVEKPLAPSARETEELLALAESKKLFLVPVHQFLFQCGVERARESLPRIGPVVAASLEAFSAGAEGLGDDAASRIALEILPHPLSLFQGLLGVGVDGLDWRVESPGAGTLAATATIPQSGALLSISISMRARPTRNEFVIAGERGTARCDLFHGFGRVEGGKVSRAAKITAPFSRSAGMFGAAAANLAMRLARNEPAYPGLRELVHRFYASIRDGGAAPIAAGDAIAVARACERIGNEFSRSAGS